MPSPKLYAPPPPSPTPSPRETLVAELRGFRDAEVRACRLASGRASPLLVTGLPEPFGTLGGTTMPRTEQTATRTDFALVGAQLEV
jgi:hypothetical protein